MKNYAVSTAITVLVMLFSFTVAQGADDLALVRVSNDFQARVVAGICGSAYARVDQQYLVSINPEQAATLSRAAIDYDIVLSDADPSDTRLLFPDRKHPELSAAIDAVDVGMGMRLIRGARLLSDQALERGSLKAVTLVELEVPIRYIPKAISNFLSTLDEFPTDSVADLVSLDSVYEYDTYLEDFGTRYIWAKEIDDARDWMVQKFLDWGYTDVTTPEFEFEEAWHYNVMAVKPGYAEPDKVIVIGGHYDSITLNQTPGPLVFAPGADDNASGTTVVLELARILANVPLRKTVIFMAFSAEEVGLVGSRAASRYFYDTGTNVEVMFNFDMVAHDPNDYRQIDLSSGPNTAYRDITYGSALRLTTLSPRFVSMGSSSDHYSFYQRGFDIMNAIETDFNDDGWHTNLDISDRLNFDYFTDVVKMAAAALAYTADAAHPTEIESVVDVGDGQSLEVTWTDCHPEYTYTLLYGLGSGVYPYSIPVSPGQCSQVVTGLTEGTTYYFSVQGEHPNAYPPAWSGEGSGVPLVIPRMPTSVTAEPGIREIVVSWDENLEGDLSHYRLYRDDGGGQALYQDNLTEASFVDTDVAALITYTYQVAAVDFDMNESDLSATVQAIPYTFDQGFLLVDETADDSYLPPQAEQEAYFDSIMGATPYTLDIVGGTTDTLPRQTAGSYEAIIWVDDDPSNKDIRYSESAISWFLSNPTNCMIAGWKTITSWVGSPVETDHVLYEEFGVVSYVQNSVRDFRGAVGQDGWPSVEMDVDNLWEGKFPLIPALEARPGATVIYTYDSFIDDPTFEGEPCGLLWDSPNGRRIVLAFPIYWLTSSSSEALMAKALEVLDNTTSYAYGDADGSGSTDIADLDFLIAYLFQAGTAPANPNACDVDASCEVDLADLDYLISYLFSGGSAPQAGCAQ